MQGVKPLVAIVGRPNVGKSTLFNRLVGRMEAIVSDIAGTTRDRITTEIIWADHPFILVDTGGLDVFPETDMWGQVKRQIEIAIDDADVILMLVDGSVGVTTADRDVANMLRMTDKPVVLVANKADNPSREFGVYEFYELGLDEPVPISAYHNLNIEDLMAKVVALFPHAPGFEEPEADLKLAIIGRTNVGKSMLVNYITGQERSIVSDIPGTTRDALDTLLVYEERQSLLLIDTAGIRRSGSIERGIERYSVLRAIRAIDRADVVVLLMDASELATAQDAHVARFVLDAYKGVVLAVNKWDLAPGLAMSKEDATNSVRMRFKFMPYAPMRFISALTGSGVDDLLDTAWRVFDEWNKSLPRYDLRRTIMNAVAANPPSASGKRPLKVYSVTQDQSGPPSFTFYVNRSDMVHFSYKRYLENSLRAKYEFTGSPLRMRFKGRGER